MKPLVGMAQMRSILGQKYMQNDLKIGILLCKVFVSFLKPPPQRSISVGGRVSGGLWLAGGVAKIVTVLDVMVKIEDVTISQLNTLC